MDLLLLTIHILVSLFVFLGEFLFTASFQSVYLLAYLIYLVVIILPDLLKNTILKLMVHAVILGLVMIFFINYDFLAILLPIQLLRLLRLFECSRIVTAVIMASPLLFVSARIEFFFCSALAWLVFWFMKNSEIKEKKQTLALESLERENLGLNRRMQQAEQWEREAEYYIKLEERRKISQKLHDEIGHTITGSIVQLQAASALLQDDPARAEEMLVAVREVLSRGMAAIRRDLKTLKPKIEEWSLEKVKKQLNEFEKQSGCRTELMVQGETSKMTTAQWQVIHANLKEALTNVIKHSSADRVFMEIVVLNKVIRVSVRDNGMARSDFVKGMGLSGMEERAREAGATLIVDGSQGFSITMIFRKER